MLSTTFIKPLSPHNLSEKRSSRGLWTASRRILIMRLGSHGDILMGTPLIKALRDAYPDAWIAWAVEDSAQEALNANPYLDELLIWHGGDFDPSKNFMTSQQKMWRRATLSASVFLRRFDTFISFQAEEWTGFTRFLTAQTAIGFFDYFNIKGTPEDYGGALKHFDYTVTKKDHPAHRTNQYLSVLKFLNVPLPANLGMTLGYTEGDTQRAGDFLESQGLKVGDPYVVIAPMSTWVTRNWSLDRYAALADRIARDMRLKPVLIGSSQEMESIEVVARRMEVEPISASGVFSFREMGALIAGANLLVGGDSGPMHVAGAVGTPYVAVFGSTPIAGRAPLNGPGISVAHPVPCGPCDWLECRNESHPLLCLDLVTVDEVLDAAKRVVGKSARKLPSASVLPAASH